MKVEAAALALLLLCAALGLLVLAIHPLSAPAQAPVAELDYMIARDYGASNDIGRVGLPEEVATMVVFLCSELCSFVVGATVPVDGGTDFF